MRNLNISKVIGGLGVLVVLTSIVLHFANRRQMRSAPAVPQEAADRQGPGSTPDFHDHADAAATVPETQELAMVEFDWRQVLTNHASPPRLPREEVEKYLDRNHRNAASLLAAYGALRDANYLREAAINFPADPRVQLSVLRQNIFPDERRKWLDQLKASSPENPLANYLSARDYFKAGQSDLAVNELVEAASKPGFKDYAMEFKLDEEELNLAAGRSSVQARLSSSAWAEDLLPELASLKRLSQDVVALQKQYLAAGDSASAESLAETALTLANGLRTGDGDKFVIKQLVANAIEAILLGQLDPNASYSFIGGQTPADRLAEFKTQKAAINEARRTVQEELPSLTEAALLSYTERQRLYGEMEAMRWLQGRSSAGHSP